MPNRPRRATISFVGMALLAACARPGADPVTAELVGSWVRTTDDGTLTMELGADGSLAMLGTGAFSCAEGDPFCDALGPGAGATWSFGDGQLELHYRSSADPSCPAPATVSAYQDVLLEGDRLFTAGQYNLVRISGAADSAAGTWRNRHGSVVRLDPSCGGRRESHNETVLELEGDGYQVTRTLDHLVDGAPTDASSEEVYGGTFRVERAADYDVIYTTWEDELEELSYYRSGEVLVNAYDGAPEEQVYLRQ